MSDRYKINFWKLGSETRTVVHEFDTNELNIYIVSMRDMKFNLDIERID